jgi:hypothetical protein
MWDGFTDFSKICGTVSPKYVGRFHRFFKICGMVSPILARSHQKQLKADLNM